jgi:hypothetical protein
MRVRPNGRHGLGRRRALPPIPIDRHDVGQVAPQGLEAADERALQVHAGSIRARMPL